MKAHSDQTRWGHQSCASMRADQNRERGDAGIQAFKIRALWADGYSNAQIATALNVSSLDVNLALGRYDRNSH